MSEVLLVNPRRRRARKKVARRRPRKRAAARRRRNPIGPYARRANPVRRRRRPARKRRASRLGMYVANPRRRTRRRRYRKNPMTMRSVLNNLVIPAAQAGAGAVLLDVAWGYVPIPDNIKNGAMRHVAKGVGAIVLGWGVGQFASKKMGDTMAMGALTVTFHAAFRELTQQFLPNVNLAYYSAGPTAGYDPALGYYVSSPRLTTRGGESHASPNSELGYYVQEGVGANY